MPAPGTRTTTGQAGGARILAMLALLAALVLALAYYTYDYLTTTAPRVADHASLLSQQDIDRISRFHDYLLADHDIDYRIVIDPDIDDLNLFAARYFRERNVGMVSDSGRGLLLVLDPQSNEVRLEVSHALESTFTDAFVAYVEHRQMTEFFAADRVADGILATTEMLIARATNAASGLDPATEGWASTSGGGGARVDARLGEGTAPRGDDNAAAGHGASPAQVLKRYELAMKDRNNNPDLTIYSKQTRDMLSQRVMTPAQMDNVAQSLSRCQAETLFRHENRAVLRYPVEERTCSPYFFLKEDEQWRLDFTVMIDALRFGRNNEWRLIPGYAGPYIFGFMDLRFDRNGYPYPQ